MAGRPGVLDCHTIWFLLRHKPTVYALQRSTLRKSVPHWPTRVVMAHRRAGFTAGLHLFVDGSFCGPWPRSRIGRWRFICTLCCGALLCFARAWPISTVRSLPVEQMFGVAVLTLSFALSLVAARAVLGILLVGITRRG